MQIFHPHGKPVCERLKKLASHHEPPFHTPERGVAPVSFLPELVECPVSKSFVVVRCGPEIRVVCMRNSYFQPSLRLQNAVEFPHDIERVWDVLKHVVAEDFVNAAGFEWYPSGIGHYIGLCVWLYVEMNVAHDFLVHAANLEPSFSVKVVSIYYHPHLLSPDLSDSMRCHGRIHPRRNRNQLSPA